MTLSGWGSPRPPARRAAVVVLGLGTGLGIVDSTVLNLALPDVGRDLALAYGDGQWLVTAYALAQALALIPAGLVSDRAGARRTFICGLVLLAAGSVSPLWHRTGPH